MAKATVPAFAPVESWPQRGRVARERTPEEIALRDALIAALAANAPGVRDPETYADMASARKAVNRYRSLLAPVVPAGQTVQSTVIGSGNDAAKPEPPFAVQMRLGVAKPRKPKAAPPTAE